ncbi:MAG: pseudaminic acid cytidylyltransferase [Oceanospirillum sp.]|nr:pseudaminic acid cytidylyltransferase [Oceanospirillum sp.]
MRVAVIPARGGSKRIPRKNIKLFAGKPMIVWSIEAALASQCFDQVIVSTDDAEIAEIAKAAGASVPFMRPEALSGDHTATIPVIAHAIEWMQAEGWSLQDVCCIYATAPFIRPEDIAEGAALVQQAGVDYAFSVTAYTFPIQRAIKLNAAGRVEMFQPDCFATRSQDLEEAWHDAGQFYWGRVDAWLNNQPIFSDKAVPVILPSYRVQDIDTMDDWQRAEWLFQINAR